MENLQPEFYNFLWWLEEQSKICIRCDKLVLVSSEYPYYPHILHCHRWHWNTSQKSAEGLYGLKRSGFFIAGICSQTIDHVWLEGFWVYSGEFFSFIFLNTISNYEELCDMVKSFVYGSTDRWKMPEINLSCSCLGCSKQIRFPIDDYFITLVRNPQISHLDILINIRSFYENFLDHGS